MAIAWKQMLSNRATLSTQAHLVPGFSRFYSKSSQYIVKVGIPEFLNGMGRGVETHIAKLETEIGDFQKLLVTRTLKLKKLGIPCKHRDEFGNGPFPRLSWEQTTVNFLVVFVRNSVRKLILKYTHKYRLGLWRPRVEPVKS